MRYLTGLFSALLFSGNLFAANLCDSSCDLSITFPDGGSIEAIETFTITFGDGGYINDGVITTPYPAGDTITAAVGDFIIFQANGSLDLGVGGNIDYTNIQITSNGVMSLAAVEGAKTVTIQDLTLLGSCSLSISSDFKVAEDGSFHLFSGPVTASTDLTFTNYGSVSGFFEFESATLTLDETTYDISGSVLIEADGLIQMTSEEVVIDTLALATDGGGSSSDSEAVPVPGDTEQASASGGLINLLSLLVVSLLLVTARYRCVVARR